jgi:hypothetical protein
MIELCDKPYNIDLQLRPKVFNKTKIDPISSAQKSLIKLHSHITHLTFATKKGFFRLPLS